MRQVVFPAVSGGEATPRELVHEFKTRGPVYRWTVRTTSKSYTNHYRRGLIKLLDVLEFRSSDHAHRPVIEALALVARYASAGNTTYYPLGETVPVHKAMGGEWTEVVHRTDQRGRRRVVRMVYAPPVGADHPDLLALELIAQSRSHAEGPRPLPRPARPDGQGRQVVRRPCRATRPRPPRHLRTPRHTARHLRRPR
ncbi:hypothetical protein GCM10010446_28700 [Streptomyces enissocaesilis]|uniref:Integrase n=1 Tax=Streptomyces enissocaesilis TaxID=332589 RepID=A0ABP6JQZ2_9ACTN